MTQQWLPDTEPLDGPAPPSGTETTSGAQITVTNCYRCGTEVSGLNGRYACALCGWVNNWSEGHTELPGPEMDPDYPGP
ncbi:hypothetical protein ABZ383_21385 [Streptomyces sp. NPDC005900]|uniref:hypothetical protein n=1 Tax=Streptomyces sp. NPDC005900 TaxID=3154569 RepID=UPI003404E5EF